MNAHGVTCGGCSQPIPFSGTEYTVEGDEAVYCIRCISK